MKDILRLIRSQHSSLPKINNDNKCRSAECLLTILCYLKDSLVFPQHLDILTSDNFLWHFIASGMSHQESVTRKRANYLFKRAIDVPFSDNADVKGNIQLVVAFLDAATYQQQRKVWEDFLIVVETLEEKQVHLIKQVFNKISQLISIVPRYSEDLSLSKPLHITWILVIFNLLFQHQNHAIVKWSVTKFLTSFTDFCIGYSEFVKFVSSSLIHALNSSKLFLYNDDLEIHCEMETLLTTFLTTFLPKEPMSNFNYNHIFWNSFLQAIFSISWGPLPLFHVTRAVSNVLKHANLNDKRYVTLERKFGG